MNTAGRLSAYGVALALVAGGGWAIGNAVGPFAGSAGQPSAEAAGHGDAHSGTVAGAQQPKEPPGLASSRGGYTLTPATTTFTPGVSTPFAFKIVKSDGSAVTAFDVEHDKRMHLIVVRRDTADFQHIHPEMAPDGTWTVPLKLAQPGSYRAFGDFVPTGGEKMTLGVDLAVPGDFRPVTYQPSWVANVDGYEVTLGGQLIPGQSSRVTLMVRKDGREVTDLQPYLGAYGHLVALRGGDLAYLHVHPDETNAKPGPSITFFAEVPSAGIYRLFLDFQHEGKVRTAEFTVRTMDAAGPAPAGGNSDDSHNDDGHGH
ncbi:MAG: hypothetical protein ABW224_20855 [Kibdelosporangium sp.]